MPHVENPGSGVLVNANNRVSPEGHPVHLSREWYGDWRFRRIHERLAAQEVNGPAEFAAIQMDAVSLLARESLPFLNSLPRGTGRWARRRRCWRIGRARWTRACRNR
jgi:penicillin G amidase